MSESVLIHTTPMSYRFGVTRSGLIKGTNVEINLFCQPFIETEYNPRTREWYTVRKYRYYDQKTETLFLPRYDLGRFKCYLEQFGVPYRVRELPCVTGQSVVVPMQPWFSAKDELQAGAIQYLVHDPEPVRGLALQTGKGKTAAAIAAISGIGRRTLIRVPSMIEQWAKAILRFTLLSENEIYVIQGMPSLAKLMQRIDKSLFPKVIIASIPTLRSYMDGSDSYVNFPPFEELCRRLNVGVVVTDEAHLNFHANYLLDLILNPQVCIPMTATFKVSSQNVMHIFDSHYPTRIRYGESEYESYVDIFAYGWRTDAKKLPKHMFRSPKGYSQVKFEYWMLTKGKPLLDDYLVNVFSPIIHMHYVNAAQAGERLLILCGMVEMCEYIEAFIRKQLPQYTSTIYVGETSDDVLFSHDVIVSTPKSAGTGRDIPDLRTVYVAVSMRSHATNEQMLGRLRKLPSGNTPIFAYSFCQDIPSHVDHADERARLFTPLAKSFRTYAL